MTNRVISLRVTRIVHLFLVSLFLILLRVWYLSVVKYEEHFHQSRKSQRRILIDSIERATICDRFGLPLARNQVQYNAAICYADIRQIPSSSLERDEDGKLKKIFTRKCYVEQFTKFLAEKLQLPTAMVEDMIYAKASLFPHTPFVIKEDIGELLYAQLKVVEKDWAGLRMQQVARRVYPQGKCAGSIVGYLGAINQAEYIKIADESKKLKNYLIEKEEGKLVFLPEGYSSSLEVRKKVKELEEKAYTINDWIGKAGVEAAFDQALRGVYGKKILEVDQKGNCKGELPGGRSAMEGEKLILSISAELQQTAEELLAEYEFFQDSRDKTKSKRRSHPWIRGGSIVVMHPKTGEILALASHPRFDPNDFILARYPAHKEEKTAEVRRWLENEAHIADVWDGKHPLTRELFSPEKKQFYEDKIPLTWQVFLESIFVKESKIWESLETVQSVEQALQIQESPEEQSPILLDLLGLIAHPEDMPTALRDEIGHLHLGEWRLYNQIACRYRMRVCLAVQELFHELEFQKWRSIHYKNFLKIKRAEEVREKRFARPYTDYLEAEEKRQFQEFWQTNRLLFLHCFFTKLFPPSSLVDPYLQKILALRSCIVDPDLEKLETLLQSLTISSQLHLLKIWKSFEELDRPLRKQYTALRKENGVQTEKHLASAFYPIYGFGYERSQAFRQSTPLGSVFKLIPAYAALCKRFEELKENVHSLNQLDLFTLVDESKGKANVLGRFASGEPIPRYYKGGRLPRSWTSKGTINLMDAIECSSNLYFSILAGDFLTDPEDLLFQAAHFGLGEKTGIDLPGEYGGALPNDIGSNKTGLYSFAIGQHSLVVTPLQTAVMLSSIANGGNVLKPQIVKVVCGKQREIEEGAVFLQREFPYLETLSLIGITFPLFPQAIANYQQEYTAYRLPQVRWTIPMPSEVRRYLIESMHRVTSGKRGGARISVINPLYQDSTALKDYREIASRLVGKTGTAEILFKPDIEEETPAQMEKHVWFGGISFSDETLQEPELVVVVYLRFGESGKEGAPMAARMVQKWREILAKEELIYK